MPARPRVTIEDAFDPRANNFDLIRLVAAVIVLISHCYPLSGLRTEPFAQYLGGYDTGGGWGVDIFFVISGFLVTRSVLARPIPVYVRSRLLRIVPALLLVTCFESFVIGPLFTTLPLNEYFSRSQTYLHLANVLIFHPGQTLPETFASNPFAYWINGSLWTLPIECMFYILLPLAAALGLLRARVIWIPLCVIAMWLAFGLTMRGWDWDHQGGRLFPGGPTFSVLKQAVFFMTGACLWIYRSRIPHSGYLALLSVVILVAFAGRDYRLAAMYVALPYLVIYVALSARFDVRGYNKIGDLSYGTYLFAFPVQQSIVALHGGGITPIELLCWSLPLCLGLAALSWHFVEKRALSFRSKPQNEASSRALSKVMPTR